MTETTTVQDPPPSFAMVQILGGFQLSQAAYVIAKLGVATILEQEGPKTVAELAERTGAQLEQLYRLVRTLAPIGLFATEGEWVSGAVRALTRSLEEGFGVFRQGTRPSRDEVIRYIDEHKDRFGVEAICRILRPAPLRVAGTVKPVPAVCSTGPDAGAAASRA